MPGHTLVLLRGLESSRLVGLLSARFVATVHVTSSAAGGCAEGRSFEGTTTLVTNDTTKNGTACSTLRGTTLLGSHIIHVSTVGEAETDG